MTTQLFLSLSEGRSISLKLDDFSNSGKLKNTLRLMYDSALR
jgi:hypothetical protein